MIRVQDSAFDAGAEINQFLAQNATSGAVATFVGQVRDFTQTADGRGKTITELELEHYPGMTEKELERLTAEAEDRWSLDDVLIIHRHGKMAPAEPIVLVCTASAHREDAFSACEFLMDWLKTQAPFWKREDTDQGTAWVDARQSDEERAARWKKTAPD